MSYVWHNYVGPALGKNECLRFAHSIVITDTAHPSQVPVIDSDNSWCDLWCVGTYVSGAVITLSRYFLLIGPHCDFSGGFEVRFQCNVMNTITFKCQYEQIRTVNTYHINPHTVYFPFKCCRSKNSSDIGGGVPWKHFSSALARIYCSQQIHL